MMKHKFLLIYSWFVRSVFFFLPDIPIFMRVRGWFYGLGMRSSGKNFQVTHSVILNTLENYQIGDNIYIANFCNFIATGLVEIGDNVIFGPSTIVVSGDHVFKNNSFRFSPSKEKPIKINSNCWIAANCTILGGSIIPNGSIVSANSAFKLRTIDNINSIYGGVPSKFIKKL